MGGGGEEGRVYGAEGGWVSVRRVTRCSERRVVQREEGEAVSHVVNLFHPPN